MERDEEHRRIAPKDVLGAVAVVYVPIDDGNATRPGCARVQSTYCDVVQEAEAHRAFAGGVVAGRSR